MRDPLNEMKKSLYDRCELFIDNKDAFKAAFPWESAYFYPICASFFMDAGKIADIDYLKDCRALLKRRVNAFSNFRSHAELSIVAMLAVCDDPEKRLDEAIEVYAGLKEHFWGSEYLPVAAMILAGDVERERYGEICQKTRKVYDLMKKEHPFLTSSEDSVFSAMLALSDKSDGEIVRETETCYNILKEKFFDKNAVQSLSHVLALSDDGVRSAGDRCRDTIRLFDNLKERGYKYGTGYELATLGILATLPCGIEETARDLMDVADFLKTQKGYGFFGTYGRTQRFMHAAMIVTSEHFGSSGAMVGAAVGSTLSLIAAQQAATCAAIAASVAAANAAHSS